MYDERNMPDVDAEHDPRPTRMTSSERRESIFAAARREFARAGYHGTSTASIARSAGCSEPMLYKHFAGKHALFTAVLERVSTSIEEEFDAVLASEGDVVQRLLDALPRMMGDSNYVEMLQLRKLAITIADEPAIHEALSGIQQRHVQRVRGAVMRAKAGGFMRADVDAERVAWSWTGMMLAGCYREALEPGGFAAMLPHVEAFIQELRPPG